MDKSGTQNGSLSVSGSMTSSSGLQKITCEATKEYAKENALRIPRHYVKVGVRFKPVNASKIILEGCLVLANWLAV